MARNLRDDYRLYYNGTWIMRQVDGELQVKLVEEVSYERNGYESKDMVMHGQAYRVIEGKAVGVNNPDGGSMWRGDEILRFLPESGYYLLNGKQTPCYLEFQVQNRTNKKGFDPQRVLHDGQQIRLTTTQIIHLLLVSDFKGKVFNDTCIHKGQVLWRGLTVGTYTAKDGLQLDEAHRYLQDHLGKQIEMYRNNGG